MAKYTFEIQSRHLFVGPEERSVGELVKLDCYCEFTDDLVTENDFDITVYSDNQRWQETVDYAISKDYLGEDDTTQRQLVRHNVQIVPRNDFFGSFFKYIVQKKIPISDGKFNWYGVSGDVAPSNVDIEFFAGMGAIS